MKKRFIAFLVVMVMVCCIFTACMSGTIHSEKDQEEIQEVAGSYHVYWTESNDKYLSFLENFDETKYEIVDISHGHYTWYITYRDIEAE